MTVVFLSVLLALIWTSSDALGGAFEAEHREDTRPSCLDLYTEYGKYPGVDIGYLRSVFYQCVDSSREWNVDDATDLMEVSLQLYLQDASRSRNVPTAILSSSNPAVAGSKEHSSHNPAVAGGGLSGPILLASERILTLSLIHI